MQPDAPSSASGLKWTGLPGRTPNTVSCLRRHERQVDVNQSLTSGCRRTGGVQAASARGGPLRNVARWYGLGTPAYSRGRPETVARGSPAQYRQSFGRVSAGFTPERWNCRWVSWSPTGASVRGPKSFGSRVKNLSAHLHDSDRQFELENRGFSPVYRLFSHRGRGSHPTLVKGGVGELTLFVCVSMAFGLSTGPTDPVLSVGGEWVGGRPSETCSRQA